MSSYLGDERVLIRGGTVLTVHAQLGDIEDADVLIDQGVIVAVGRDLPDSGARLIDSSGHYVLPGFIDTHRHTWQSVVHNVASDWSLGQLLQARGALP